MTLQSMKFGQTYLSLLLFISVAGVGAFLSSASRRHYAKLSATSTSIDGIECALLELENPGVVNGITKVLENDDMVTKVVKDVSTVLYIYIRPNPKESEEDQNIREYISSIYQRLWDEMIQRDKMSLNCIVVGNMRRAGLISRSQIHNMPALDAVYTADPDVISSINGDRLRSSLKEVQVHDTSKIGAQSAVLQQVAKSLDDPTAKGGLAFPLYFFDDIGANNTNVPTYSRVALGGTFDQIHNGHKKLLTLAASVCTETLVIGVTGNEMLKKKKNAELISSFADRKLGVESFMQAIKPTLKIETVELVDPFGPTVEDGTLDAIVVSSETIGGAQSINQKREAKGHNPLAVLVTRRSESATLSSTFIRDLEGKKKKKRFNPFAIFQKPK